MTKDTYKQAIDAAIKELSDLMSRREELEAELERVQWRIETVGYGIDGLAELSGIDPKKDHPHLFQEDIKSDVGFTDAVRKIIKSGGAHQLFTPVIVRDELKKKSFDLSKYQNPLASIHTILKRLRINNEITALPDETSGKVLYTWNFAKEKKKSEK